MPQLLVLLILLGTSRISSSNALDSLSNGRRFTGTRCFPGPLRSAEVLGSQSSTKTSTSCSNVLTFVVGKGMGEQDGKVLQEVVWMQST